ncbi:unnamed protein product [Prorocentrum cordatum]|uniref:Uncharacterized protein n=1 Tax=Prorocentrum cordatum TaxID=2364126 RepID=A0ABN9VJZ1_9DINO|nr:unnamed protein product [Polarella glacialis]
MLGVGSRLTLLSQQFRVAAVSAGSVSGKSVTKHVIVKDLRKVAGAMKVDLPASGIFDHLAPIGLYALFDGQSCAGPPGPVAAEYCARNFHKKVLENVCSLPANCTSDTFVKAALVKSFEDLDKDLLEALPDTEEGCGAAVALLVGEYLFTASAPRHLQALAMGRSGKTLSAADAALAGTQFLRQEAFVPSPVRAPAAIVAAAVARLALAVALADPSGDAAKKLGDASDDFAKSENW